MEGVVSERKRKIAYGTEGAGGREKGLPGNSL